MLPVRVCVDVEGGANNETAEDFFLRIQTSTSTLILWPSRLKVGAKSKKGQPSCWLLWSQSLGKGKCEQAVKDVNIHTYIHTHIHIHIHTYTHTYIHTYIHTHIHTYMHAYMYARIN